MSFDVDQGATIAIEFRRKEESEGLEQDALRQASQFSNGTATVTFSGGYGKAKPQPAPRIHLEYEEAEPWSRVQSRVTYMRLCGGTVGIALRYGRSQAPALIKEWEKIEAMVVDSVSEASAR